MTAQEGQLKHKAVVLNPMHTLLESLISSAEKLEASSLHIYIGPRGSSCYFEVGGKLELTGKKFSDKVLEELVDFLKSSANLEKSDLEQAQGAKLQLSEGVKLNLTFISSSESKSSHLILHLESSSKTKSFEDLGFWGRALEDLEAVLDSAKGIVIIDSQDQYTLRSFIYSSLNYLKQDRRVSSVSFDSSLMQAPEVRNHDRIFTKLDASTLPLAKSVLNSNPAVVVLLDPINQASLNLAIEQSRLGKLVFIVTSEGSCAESLNKALDLVSNPEELLAELKLVVSVSPIQTIASSNGKHQLNKSVIAQLESFFGLNLPESWRSIYSHAGIKNPEELLHLDFPIASEHGCLTDLVEVLKLTDYIRRSSSRNPNLGSNSIGLLAAQSGMMTKREDGLVKALRKEVDLADVIDICK